MAKKRLEVGASAEIKQLFETPAGNAMLEDLKQQFLFKRSDPLQGPYHAFFETGQRDVVIYILEMVGEI